MNLFIKRSAPVLGLLGLGLAGCQPTIEAPSVSAGSADFSRYVAIGNSLTAGYADGGLYREGQLNSYPSILAGQFATAGGGDFVQPLFTEAQSNGSGYLKLMGFTAAGSPITAPVTSSLAVRGGTAASPLYTKFTDQINNLGVPGIRMSDIQTAGYGSQLGNPYFERITLDTNPFQTYLDRIRTTLSTLKPTFFSEWLGNNDVLGYATAGGAANSLTRTDTFTLKTNRLLNVLVSGGAKGVVMTIPDVTGIPFFTTVGPSFKKSLLAAGAPGVVAFTGAAPGAPASGNRKQIPTTDIRDANGGRQLFTLTSSPYLGLLGRPTGLPWRALIPRANLGAYLAAYSIDTTAAFGASAGNPLPSAYILDDVEQGLVAAATASYNTSISSGAAARNLALFDANAFFRTVATAGVQVNAANNTASYLSGNLFSLDGVHPTPRGYAIIANEIIRAINTKYGSSLTGVNPNNYRAVAFPQ